MCLDLIHAAPKERIEKLKTAFGINFTDLDKERARIFEQRTEKGREEKLLTGQLNAYRKLPETLSQLRTTEDILEDIAKVEKVFERERESQELRGVERSNLQKMDDHIIEVEAEYKEQKNTIADIAMKIKDLESELKVRKSTFKDLGEILSDQYSKRDALYAKMSKGYTVSQEDRDTMDKLKAELKEVSLQEKTLQEIKLRDDLHNTRESIRREIRSAGRSIDEIDKKKKSILSKVTFPVNGMEFGENDVMHNGIPFTNCSTAEQLKISIAINAHINTGIKIMKIEEGSLLDENSLAEVEAMAKDKGIQIWLEEVDSGKDNNVLIIEEGHVKE